MIVALDLATQTGVAYGLPGSIPTTFSRDLGKGQSENLRFANALRLIDGLIQQHKPSLVVVEAPVKGPRASPFLIGFVAIIRACCAVRKSQVQMYEIATVRKHFIGKHLTSASFKHLPQNQRKNTARKQIKELVISRCEALGWTVEDDNAADAAALWDLACSQNSKAHAAMTAGPLLRGNHNNEE